MINLSSLDSPRGSEYVVTVAVSKNNIKKTPVGASLVGAFSLVSPFHPFTLSPLAAPIWVKMILCGLKIIMVEQAVTKAKEKLGWEQTTSCEELVAEMARSDLDEAKRDALCKQEGFKTFNRHE